MKFTSRPILSEMKALYLKPASMERFREYLFKLQGDSEGDMVLPVARYNPMAKEHILEKIEELESLDAEAIMEEVIGEFNSQLHTENERQIHVVLNLADDLKGAWTNFYTTDFDSKFKLSAFVNRNFCTPYFWTSEHYTKGLIRLRTKEYLSRTLFRINYPQPRTLEEHVIQEQFVAKKSIDKYPLKDTTAFDSIERFYLKHKSSDDYNVIFNFFYGDIASESLGYKTYGIREKTGFDYAKFIGLRGSRMG